MQVTQRATLGADMNDKPSENFQHPLVRAKILRPAGVFDRISLRDHVVSVEIGAFEIERAVVQRLSFNVVVEVQDVKEPLEDDVDKILSYDRVTDAISQALESARVNLLETLAQDIASRILAAPQATRVFVRIEKLDRGVGDLGVEIVRDVKNIAAQDSDWRGPAPLVVVAADGIDLNAWLPTFKSHMRPVILLPYCKAPVRLTGNTAVDQRLGLLAWDAAAWTFSALSDDLAVVASRTELEWGFGQGQVNVWAPMKLTLDSATPADRYDVTVMATWIAQFTGGRVIGIGCPVGLEIAASGQSTFAELS